MSCNDCSCSDKSRRSFLGGAATLVASATIAPGVILNEVKAKADDEKVSGAVRWGILIDTNKCAKDCNACVTACHETHGVTTKDRPATDAQWIRKVTVTDKSTGHSNSFPVMCQHCETAPCADVCPTGASFRRADGIVLVDKHLCIGCRYCMMACPYKARSFIHESLDDQLPHAPRGKGTVESCTMCVYRVDKGGKPACVEACAAENHNAMIFGDLNDPESEISISLKEKGGEQIRADLGLNTGVRYRGLE